MNRNVVSSARQRRLPGIPNNDQWTTNNAAGLGASPVRHSEHRPTTNYSRTTTTCSLASTRPSTTTRTM
jgi:hypothetical protein